MGMSKRQCFSPSTGEFKRVFVPFFWLPRKHPPQGMSYPIESLENSTVAVLINETTRQWNEELIDGVFACDEATLIKKIPLGRVASEDVVIWPYSHDGRKKPSYNPPNSTQIQIQYFGMDGIWS